MTTPVDMGADHITAGFEPGLEASDWSTEVGGADGGLDREINDRRSRLESAETLRLARAL